MSHEDEDTPNPTEVSTSGSGSPYKDERDDTIERQEKLGSSYPPLPPLNDAGEEQGSEAKPSAEDRGEN